MWQEPIEDLVVVIPGITGSRLGDGRQGGVGPSPGALGRGIATFLDSVKALRLPADLGDDHPGDGVVPTGLVPSLHAVPGVRPVVDGYSNLMRLLPADEAAVQLRPMRAEPEAPDQAPAATLAAAAERLHDREDTDAEREYEQQRTALWPATIGLGAVYLIGVTLAHQPTMMLGALGGFLSPVIGVMRSQRPASWGVLVLAPVGGALAAIGGMPLVRMLADPELNLLGHVFLDNSWDAPDRPLALAIALLFGFSGTLFSRLALTATGQLVATNSPPARQL
ncbi:hypothetical protein [Kitasatospora sp. NPDC008115]|uniref:hypothetical protein n=1 Tax=Kitasatospora sp. NPDC008115 TaxID=3364022 RepID=UPI0036EAFACD